MKKSTPVLSKFIIIFFVISAASNLFGQETKIKVKDLPPAVAAAFKSSYPNAIIIGTAREIEKGITYFEIESKDGTVRRDLLYTKNGKVSEIEETLTAETIPDFVKKSLEDKFKKVEFIRGEKNIWNSATKFEVIVVANKLDYEVVCDTNGKIIKTTKLKKNGKDKEGDNN